MINNPKPINNVPKCLFMRLGVRNKSTNTFELNALLNFSTEWVKVLNYRADIGILDGELSIQLNGCEAEDTRINFAEENGSIEIGVKASSSGKDTEDSQFSKSAGAAKSGIKIGVDREFKKTNENQTIIERTYKDKDYFVKASGDERNPVWKFTIKNWSDEQYLDKSYEELLAHLCIDKESDTATLNAEFNVPKDSLVLNRLECESLMPFPKFAVIKALIRHSLWNERFRPLSEQSIVFGVTQTEDTDV